MKVKIVNFGEYQINDEKTIYDILKNIKIKNKDKIIAAKLNNKLTDLSSEINDNDIIEFIDFNSEEGKSVFWHSSSHILAQAVKELFPEAKLAIGPSIAEGFYYDFDVPQPFTPEDLEKIQAKAEEIIKRDIKIKRFILTKEEAIKKYQELNEKYKIELIEDINEPELSFYSQDNFFDLCRGPHIYSTGIVKAFKILNTAGAYWRGDERNPMLQRIYGISFLDKQELKEFIRLREEALKRDHRKLGKELDLFSFHNEAPGFPFFHSNGLIIYNEIINFWRQLHKEEGYEEVKTPFILNQNLWIRSGHWEHYRENMYFTEIEKEIYAVKPMNCPGGLLIYKSKLHSYRELPIKMAELGQVHRHEKSGVLHGLFRVRTFTVDDAHIFCTEEQIEDEVIKVIELIFKVIKVFGFEKYFVELSTRPKKSIGTDEIWEISTKALQNALEKLKIPYELNPGEGAFYGPKIDFHIEDCLKRSWQCGTIQLDFSMPEKFELEYIAEDGKAKRPVMIHRAIFGSVERFMGMLIEHYGGAFPLWLSPVQVIIIPVSNKFLDYGKKVFDILKKENIRVEIDEKDDTLMKKIRNAQVRKIPYACVIGAEEENNGSVNVRRYKSKEQEEIKIEEFIKRVLTEIKEKRYYLENSK
ncbi:MAG TPA: threonine--tRNA ligase [bacterium]|nr:threonine--tRNA ligase [bacterium]HOL47310.1 threonine--tRNA ligase [bacterium]HPQ17647.1 threonine--tRNA ligase [bacterium]